MKLKTENKVSPLFQMSSLTDIIFLLLIFFMLTSTMVAPNAIKLLLPNATGQTLASQSITVSVSDDLKYFVESKEVPLNLLEYEIKKAIEGNTEETATIVLRVDKRVEVENLVEVLKIGNKLAVRMILATKPEN